MKKRILMLACMACMWSFTACAQESVEDELDRIFEETEDMAQEEVKEPEEEVSEAKVKETSQESTGDMEKEPAKETGSESAKADEKVANDSANIADEYQYLFTNGSFDENQVWSSNKEEYSELVDALKKACKESAVGSFMLATDEEVIFAGGFNALETDGKTTINAFTTYEIGTLTQQFMTVAILQQVQDGKLQLSDTIDKFFPDYPHGAMITIDHLLHMESGIPDYLSESNKFFKGRTAQGYEDFMNGQMSDEEILGFLYKAELNFEPGKKTKYSNTNYYLLALILEQVTGETYEDYMQKHIYDVCDMKSSTCTQTGNLTSVPQGNEGYLEMGRVCRGVADMHSNVCDILLWDRALMAGYVIDETGQEFMKDFSREYTCGWRDMGNGAIYFDGSTWTYAAMNAVYPYKGENLYMIMMLSDFSKISQMEQVAVLVEEHIGL